MIAIVTATVNKPRAEPCLASWTEHARGQIATVALKNGSRTRMYLGPVPAFRKSMDLCLARHTADIIACFHDDLVVLEKWWDQRVLRVFVEHPEVGLVGFAGASGLGTDALYREDYAPEQLAWQGYRSNLVDAEAHGERSLEVGEVAAVDNFALIGRRAFWEGIPFETWRATHRGVIVNETRRGRPFIAPSPWTASPGPWSYLEEKGVVNHFYGAACSCLARRRGWQVYYVPIRCRHLGGQTVGDPGYQQWAETEIAGGDRGFREAAFRIGYVEFKDTLPLRVEGAGGRSAAALS